MSDALHITPADIVLDTLSMPAAAHTLRDVEEITRGVLAYLDERVERATATFPGRSALLLSAGIDSAMLAAHLARSRPDTLCLTFAAGGDNEELRVAREVAQYVGLDHVSVAPTRDTLRHLSTHAAYLLDTPDVWQIAAAVPYLALAPELRTHGIDGPIFTGGGADAMFLGGRTFDSVSHRDREWAGQVHESAERALFPELHPIPDFTEKVLGADNAFRLVEVWRTTAAYELASQIAPEVVRGKDDVDKHLLRTIAEDKLGLPGRFAWREKSPLQVSSGMVGAFIDLAREDLRASGRHSAYTDPIDDPVELIAARLWLSTL